jgi:myosin heavy subunit
MNDFSDRNLLVLQETELSGTALSNLQTLDPQCLDETVCNLIGLSNLSENALLHNLRIRFKSDAIYTFVSSILIAVNPFRQLPIYGVETLEKYRSTVDKSTLPPHIFTIADNAFRAMMNDGASQSVVISGESGAGELLVVVYIHFETL